MDSIKTEPAPITRNVDPKRLLYSLMIPGIIMPLAGWMFSVSLPIIRDDFQIPADSAAWIATSFSLPFMILMPVYGRLSDGLGKRRLLLWSISIFTIGSFIAFSSTSMRGLIIARIIQGLGISGTLPLILALLGEAFSANERGGAMGSFSTVGPVTGVVGPLLAGFVVARGGWRMAFLPPIVIALISIAAVYFLIPNSGRKIDFGYLRRFDWVGVGLLSLTLSSLLFYLSSRPITGIDPLKDWRLGLATLFFAGLFVFYELNRQDPFIRLGILSDRSLAAGSLCAMLRMACLSGGFGFLMPLYLADVIQLTPSQSGFYLMLNPAAMILFVRFGGNWADKYGGRSIVFTGFSILAIAMLGVSRLESDSPGWFILSLIPLFGVGAGLMLAALHQSALSNVSDAEMGSASGVYSMIRFLGSALGAAVGGILLKNFIDTYTDNLVSAYQSVYLIFAFFAITGLMVSLFLPSHQDPTNLVAEAEGGG